MGQLKYCAVDGCSNLVERGKYCSEHAMSDKARQAKRRKRSVYVHENKPIYRTERWHEVCMAVDLREHNRCQHCGRYCWGKHKQHHHIVPIAIDASLTYDPNNIMLLCDRCHPIVEHEQEDTNQQIYPSYFTR